MTDQQPHPEDFCDTCGAANPVWWVDSARWNVAYPDTNPIVCPNCFVAAYTARLGTTDSGLWEFRLDERSSLFRELQKRSAAEAPPARPAATCMTLCDTPGCNAPRCHPGGEGCSHESPVCACWTLGPMRARAERVGRR